MGTIRGKGSSQGYILHNIIRAFTLVFRFKEGLVVYLLHA